MAIKICPLVVKIEFCVDNISAVPSAVKTIPNQFVYIHRPCWHEIGDKDY